MGRVLAAGCILLIGLLAGTLPAQQGEIEIVHLNVGQGDATLFLGPPGADGSRFSVLVDAGDIPFQGDLDGGAIVRDVLEDRGVTRLDVFVATHYDADHIGGIVAGSSNLHGTSFILGPNGVPGAPGDDDGNGHADWLPPLSSSEGPGERPDPEELGLGDDLPVDLFVDRGDSPSLPSSVAVRKYLGIANAAPRRLSFNDQAGVDSFEIDLGGGAKMFLIAANGYVRNRSARVARVSTENERSLCFLFRFGGFDYLIGGYMIGTPFGSEDAEVERAVGEYIASQGINVDVLHVGHHGANNASDAVFLDLIDAEVAIISCGNDNSHEHPSRFALGRLAESVDIIYQTNWGSTEAVTQSEVRRRQAIAQGDIVITSDGSQYRVETTRRLSTDG